MPSTLTEGFGVGANLSPDSDEMAIAPPIRLDRALRQLEAQRLCVTDGSETLDYEDLSHREKVIDVPPNFGVWRTWWDAATLTPARVAARAQTFAAIDIKDDGFDAVFFRPTLAELASQVEAGLAAYRARCAQLGLPSTAVDALRALEPGSLFFTGVRDFYIETLTSTRHRHWFDQFRITQEPGTDELDHAWVDVAALRSVLVALRRAPADAPERTMHWLYQMGQAELVLPLL